MIPGEFISKWRASELKERSASQEHFIDLCRLLDEATPAEADPTGDTYCFEKGARRETGGDGWADVWKRHCFAWEYKGLRANLDAAFDQLRQYALALENPPLLIVSDMRRFRIRTNWTNSVSEIHDFDIEDLADAAVRDKLKWAVSDPERLRPRETRQALTERAAKACLTHALRIKHESNEQFTADTTWLAKILSDCRLPTPHQRAANLIRYIGDQVAQTGDSISVSPDHLHAIIGEFSRRSCLALYDEVAKSGILRFRLGEAGDVLDDSTVAVQIPTQINLTLEGWARYEAEHRGDSQGHYGFIAMKFGDPDLDPFVRDVVKPAVRDDLGYDLLELREVSRAGVIDDIMRIQIRDATFVIADLTHDNSGAYWEAGYAEGLGKPVIYMCEKAKFEDRGTHFDTNHCTTVLWCHDDPDVFREKLIATIRRSLEPV